jgi:hypothetical protein
MMALLAGVLLIGGVFAAAAQATSYGEIQRFGAKGTALGQFNEPEPAFGVDTKNNDIYVVDNPKGGKTFRIQEFSDEKEKGKWEAVASETFKPKSGEEPDEIEGVAVDPELERVYVLALQERKGKQPDEYVPAAADIYAFNAKPTGTKLEPLAGTEGGLFVSPAVLQPTSLEQGVSLLEPGGITVNPKTHELIIAAEIDRGKKNKNGNFEQEGTTILQPISDTGALGERYVDSREEENPETGKVEEKSFFEECECVNSPVVSPTTGAVYVMGESDQIDQIPMSSHGALPPAPVIEFNCEVGCPLKEELTEFPGASPGGGSQLSIGPEGRFYIRAKIRDQTGGEQQYAGALVYSSAFKEEGWTGGQSPASAAGKCIVRESFGEEEPSIAASGEADTFFMFQRNSETEEPGKPGNGPKIVEFGPEGTGCPTASATVPTAKSGGVEVEPVPVGENVTLSSTLTQANALSVEWTFGHEGTQPVSTREGQTTEVQHTFTEEGKLTIKEKIHTDDLATPVIEVERTIDSVGKPTVTTEPEPKVEGTSVTLKGTVNPNDQPITACEFEYGTTEKAAGEKYPSSESCPSPAKGVKPVSVSAKVTGLEKHKIYYFRLVATNDKGSGEGDNETFTTVPKPAVVIEAASVIGQTTATFNAKVNPEGEATTCRFEYGTSSSFGSQIPCATSPGSGSALVAVSAAVTGLSPGTTYHVRIVASNPGGATTSEEKTFPTAAKEVVIPPPPNETTTTQTSSTPQVVVEPHKEAKEGAPDATLASGGSATVSSSGAFTVKISCPAGEKSCSGTVTLRTLKAVVASVGHLAKSKAAVLTLATASFSVTGGQTKTLTLHLSSTGRALLARTHSVSARITIVARDPEGASHTGTSSVTLRPAKGKKATHH